MKKTLLLLALFTSFCIPELTKAVSPNLTAELVEVERTRSGFDNLDAISFWAKVTNNSSVPLYDVDLNLRILEGKAKTSNGSVMGSRIVSIQPYETIKHPVGAHMLKKSETLTGKAEFAFSDEFVSEEEFKKLKIFSSPFTSKPLSKSVDIGRGKLTMKATQNGIPKVFVRGSKNAPLLALSFKGNMNMDFKDVTFTYYSEDMDLGANEITNVSLWSGKTMLCGPIPYMAAPGGSGFDGYQNFVTFSGCNINIKKNKNVTVTLKGDVSKNIPNGSKRSFYLSGYNAPPNTDIKSGITQGKQFGFK